MHSLLTSDYFIGIITSDLNPEFIEKDFCKHASNTITEFVTTKLAPLCSQLLQPNEKKSIKTFIQKLEIMNEQFNEKGLKDLLQPAIQQLKQATVKEPQTTTSPRTLPPTPTKVQQVITSPQSIKNASPIAPPIKVKAPTSSSSLQKIHTSISTLDLSNSNFQTSVKTILTDIKKLKVQDPSMADKLNKLEAALECLVDAKAFGVSVIETQAFKLLTPHLQNPSQEYHPTVIKGSVLTAQSQLLKVLKRSSPDTLLSTAETLPAQMLDLTNKAIQERVSSLLFKTSTNSQIISQNLSQVVQTGKACEKDVGETVDAIKTKVHAIYDGKTGGKFSSLMKNYSESNIETQKPSLVSNYMELFFTKLGTTNIGTSLANATPVGFRQEMQSFHQERKKYLNDTLNDMIVKNFKADYKWFVANIDAIKKPYNQGDDEDRNLGGGTCLLNSIERLSHLKKSPKLASDKIEMGSSSKGRFSQLRFNPSVIQEEHYQKFGLTTPRIEMINAPLNPLDSSRAYVINALFDIKDPLKISAHQGAFIFCFRSNEVGGGGHAIDIQFSRQHKIYRFIDDNIGVCEYSTEKDFKEGFQTYLEALYPKYTNYMVAFPEEKSKTHP